MALISWLLVIVYLGVRFAATPLIDQWTLDLPYLRYWSYVFELLFVILVLGLHWSKWKWNWALKFSEYIWLAVCGFVGFAVFLGAKAMRLEVPFEFSSIELVVFLIGIGPLLEEFVFRGALWILLERITHSPRKTLWITALIFSFGHFYAYFFVLDSIRPFIIYQTIYTLGLGLWLGIRLHRTGNLMIAYSHHLIFNFSFYLASQVA